VVLALTAFMIADMEWLARIHSLLMALVVFALSVIPGRSWGKALLRDEPGA
jgi:hypothetical protein